MRLSDQAKTSARRELSCPPIGKQNTAQPSVSWQRIHFDSEFIAPIIVVLCTPLAPIVSPSRRFVKFDTTHAQART